MGEMGKNGSDRAGGRRACADVNPPAFSVPRDGRKPALERDFSPIANPPAVLTTRELCAKLGSLGYEDADTPQAETFVDTVGYQHAKQYLPDSRGGTLRKAHSLMVFDLEFQGVLLKYIGYFEIAFRARYSREMAERRGPFAHRNPKNFSDSRHFDEFLDRYGAELSRAVRRDGEARSNVEEYGDLPIWAASEIMSFGTLSMLYRNTRSRAIKDAVARSFGVEYQVMVSWLRALSSARNQCAHFGRMLGRSLVSRPRHIDFVGLDNSSPFYIVVLLVALLDEDCIYQDDLTLSHVLMLIRDVSELMIERSALVAASGLPTDWRDVLRQAVALHGRDLKFNDSSPDVARRRVYLTAGDDRTRTMLG